VAAAMVAVGIDRRGTLRQQVAEKRFGMLRGPQHERKIPNYIKTPPFVLSTVEGLRWGFQQSASPQMMGENGLRTKPESQRQREKNESDALV
jgi:hypothetical protein